MRSNESAPRCRECAGEASMLAQDVMTRDVVTVGPETPVTEIAKRLVERRISAVPVVGADGTAVGIVSEGDLLRRREIGTERRTSWWLEVFGDPDALARAYTKAHGLAAADVMSSPVICVEEEAPLATVADMLQTHGIKRVPVLRRGKLVGIVSRADVVRALLAHAGVAAKPVAKAPDDRAIERALRERMGAESWAKSGLVNAVVHEGVVALHGFVRSEEQRRGLQVLAREIPGVRAVEDHLTVGTVAGVP
jgi:CBS domain-containing protein